MADPNNVKSIFLAASEKPAADRSAFLDEATGSDTALRVRVEALLKAHDNPDSFLNEAAAKFGATVDLSRAEQPLAERPGTLIGPYKLLEQIGEGGMGIVYMADQQAPVRRRVALKIIKAGMGTRQVIARFEAERQALALMDHSNIARVLDAGATESGRPYFVMELVRGLPITEYCDQNNLLVHERLELFVQVCHAVQHAHQKGIIHRDLKPPNVLVTLNDGRAVPKVIDFGVAKATNQELTEMTLFTAFSQMVGTPLYMSPEQAEMTSLDIDTRSDIYSLGVLLYELLTGTTPFDQARMRAAAFDEIRRIIREEEPPKPSTRISTLGETRAATAAQRQVDSHRLGKLVEGDLDWIVMKALEKDRTRRYDTAGNFAADVLRHLSDQPVEACPPSAVYRCRKFARRNKAMLGILGFVAILLLSTVAILAVSNARIRRESGARAVALNEKDAALVTARRAVDQMVVHADDETLVELPITNPARRILLEDALAFYEGFGDQGANDDSLHFATARALRKAARVQGDLGRWTEARRSAERSIELLERLVAQTPSQYEYREELAASHYALGFLWHLGVPQPDLALAETHMRKSLDILNTLEQYRPDHLQRAVGVLKNLAECQAAKGDPAAAANYWQQAIARGEAYLKQQPTDVVERVQLSWCYFNFGSQLPVVEKEAMIQKALGHAEIAARYHPRNLGRRTSVELRIPLADVYRSTKRTEQAIVLCQQAFIDAESIYAVSPIGPGTWGWVRAVCADRIVPWLRELGREQESLEWVNRYRDCFERIAPDVPVRTTQTEVWQCQLELVSLLRSTGQQAAAIDVLNKSFSRLAILDGSAVNGPEDAWRLAWRGIGHCGLRRWKDALSDLQLAEKNGLKPIDIPLEPLIRTIPWNTESPGSMQAKELENLGCYLVDVIQHVPLDEPKRLELRRLVMGAKADTRPDDSPTSSTGIGEEKGF